MNTLTIVLLALLGLWLAVALVLYLTIYSTTTVRVWRVLNSLGWPLHALLWLLVKSGLLRPY